VKEAANICRHLLTYAEVTLPDLTDEHLALVSETNGKTAGWIIGHLCVTGDFLRRKSGRAPMTPREWGPKFTIGSKPSRVRDDYPTMDELRTTFLNIYKDLAEVAADLPADLLDAPSPFEPGRARFPTMRAFMQWVLTGHLGYHLGQLYGWRSAVGLRERA
jgi:hypothetical protein